MSKFLLAAICLLLVGCAKQKPWQEVTKDGPWFRPGGKAVVYQRSIKKAYTGMPSTLMAFEKDGEMAPIDRLGYEIDMLSESSKVVTAWVPDQNKYTGRFLARTPPQALYLVAVDPIVLVGARENYGGDDEDYGKTFFSAIFGEIPIATKVPQEGESVMAIVNTNGELVKHDIKVSELPDVVSLGLNDEIFLTLEDNHLVVTRRSESQ